MNRGVPFGNLRNESDELRYKTTELASLDLNRSFDESKDDLHGTGTSLIEMLGEIASALVRSDSFRNILADCTESIRTHVDAESVGIWTFDHTANTFTLVGQSGKLARTTHRRSARSFPFSRITRDLKPFVSTVGRYERSSEEHSPHALPQNVGFAGYPLKVNEVLLGVLMINSGRPLSQIEKSSLACAANSIALTIDHEITGESLHELEESSLLKTAALESTANGVAITDIHGNIEWVNKAFSRLTGYSLAEAKGQNPRVLKSGKTPESVYHELWATISKGDVWSGEIINRRKDGKLYDEEMTIAPVRDSRGSIAHFVAIKQDITLRKSLEAKLTHRTLHDPLTKLANRVLFHDRLSHSLERSKRRRMLTSVLFLDLDNFKTVNDTLGHGAGDELLKKVAERLLNCIRSTDTAARFGGDEFAILVESKIGSDGHLRVAESIRESLHEPFLLEGKEAFIGSSIGIASTSNADKGPDDLMRDADIAMYIAKNGGKDRYAVYHHEMHEAVLKKTNLETDMREAIKRKEFELHYQPVVRLDSCSIIGMEALIRWRHPEQGLLFPSDFISIAEESKLIIPIGEWALGEACRQANRWHTELGDRPKPWLSVNISARQFQDVSLDRIVETALATSGLSPNSLVLEISEGTLLRNTPVTIEKLARFRSAGIRIAIDSFGTGYSSLNYLQTFPIDVLKLDRSFTSRILVDEHGSTVAKAIIEISNSLGFRSLAEGVETAEQRQELINMGCEFGQGFFFSEPLPSSEMQSFLISASTENDRSPKRPKPRRAGATLESVDQPENL